ncbi:MAG TPA: BON domain-containing protein [Chloroflexota bacterium]|nr:BON domain-containing protein [Chloroflexota bacterium]
MAKHYSTRKTTSETSSNQNPSSPAKARSRSASEQPTHGTPPASSPGPRTLPAAQTSLADMLRQVHVALAPVAVYGLTVASNQSGVVRLEGAVRTERDHELAERLAAESPGVQKVVNGLVVDPLVGSMPVQRAVLSPELAAEIELNHFHFASGTENRFNDMIGTTDTAEAADEAEPYFPPTDPVVKRAPRDAQGIEVVGGFSPTSLDSPIDLEQLPRRLLRSDDEIARQVRLAFEQDASTADLQIYTAVRHGVVHLRGTVLSLADAEAAEAVAARVPGVIEVMEEIDVAGV